MPTPIVRDHAIAVCGEEEHLVLECVRRKRPPVTENNRLTRAPVLVVDLSAVDRGECGHIVLSLRVCVALDTEPRFAGNRVGRSRIVSSIGDRQGPVVAWITPA
jgi:hypothetical protein